VADVVHDLYEDRPPSPDNLVRMFEDQWVSALPGYASGEAPLFDDHRIKWGLERAGGVQGKRVLELGPLEGGHTYMLQKAGARAVTSIEANSICYTKCLLVQRLYGLDRVDFQLGNFIPWLQTTRESFDLAVAVGVLYHTVDPVEVLENLTRLSPHILLWTHYVDLKAMPKTDPRYRHGITGIERRQYRDLDYRVFRRQYHGNATTDAKFCGGVHTAPVWLEKRTIRRVLDLNGFDVEIAFDEPGHPAGPAVCMFATRRGVVRRLRRTGSRGRALAGRVKRKVLPSGRSA